MKLRFRNGLSGSTNLERLALLNTERYMIAQALQQHYWGLLDGSGALVCETDRLKPLTCSLRWARKSGKLLVQGNVFVGPDRDRYSFKLRVNTRMAANPQLKVYPQRYLREA